MPILGTKRRKYLEEDVAADGAGRPLVGSRGGQDRSRSDPYAGVEFGTDPGPHTASTPSCLGSGRVADFYERP